MPLTAASAPALLDRCLRLLIASNGLHAQARPILQVREELLRDFRPEWIEKNLKFDLSLSSGPGSPPRVRWSYNNFGEAASFPAKIDAVFALFPGAYDRRALQSVLEVMRPTTDRHQTTLGFEWTSDDPRPRIKVYFEELQHAYTEGERRRLARAVAAAAGESETHVPRESLAAIAVDFFPDGSREVKLYSLFSSLDGILRQVPVPEPLQASWRAACAALSREKRCFYYLTRRTRGGNLASLKLYKIYEFAQFDGPAEALAEVRSLLERWNLSADLRRLSQLSALCRRDGFTLQPVIASIDSGPKGVIKIDTYLALRGQA